jgi:8-oxo-dGTP pyrophosphatase MutT (NUDIX family)
MDPQIRLPDDVLAATQTASDAEGTSAPSPAASVVLMRDSAAGIEVHLLMRAASMAFAAGRPVFPGGRVDATDMESVAGWAGPTIERWAADLEVDQDRARAIINAAVRETFEECGYLLASPENGTLPLTDLSTDDWCEDRELLLQRRISVADLFARRRLTLRSDWLKPWSVWVTPSFEPRRFHTWFLVARCPAEQLTLGVSHESTTSQWISAEQALRQADDKALPLLPPQYCTLLELFECRDVDEVFDSGRSVRTVRPEVGIDNEGPFLELPDELVRLGLLVGIQMYGEARHLS